MAKGILVKIYVFTHSPCHIYKVFRKLLATLRLKWIGLKRSRKQMLQYHVIFLLFTIKLSVKKKPAGIIFMKLTGWLMQSLSCWRQNHDVSVSISSKAVIFWIFINHNLLFIYNTRFILTSSRYKKNSLFIYQRTFSKKYKFENFILKMFETESVYIVNSCVYFTFYEITFKNFYFK